MCRSVRRTSETEHWWERRVSTSESTPEPLLSKSMVNKLDRLDSRSGPGQRLAHSYAFLATPPILPPAETVVFSIKSMRYSSAPRLRRRCEQLHKGVGAMQDKRGRARYR